MSLVTGNQLLVHVIGDYFLQSDWMATTKKERVWPCLTHAWLYTLPFIILTRSVLALIVIFVTHFLIDYWKFPVLLSWLKNFLSPKSFWVSWSESVLGYHPERPLYLVVWLSIIIDNTLHLVVNGLCLRYL